MISSLGATLRISLRRSRADWPIVLAAGLICLLAATLLAAGAIYANAVSLAGLHRVLADAPVESANISVSTRVPTGDVEAVHEVVEDELGRVFGPVGGEVLVSARSDSFALPDQPTDEVRVLAVLGFAGGMADHASLVDGAWPDETATSEDDILVAVAERVATGLGLEVGRRLPLRSQLDDGFVVPVRVVAVFRIDDPTDPFWWDETLALEGLVSSERFDTWSAWGSAPGIGRMSCRVASSSASRSPAPSPTGRICCWRTNRPVSSTRGRGARS